jgi:hypothetical protein
MTNLFSNRHSAYEMLLTEHVDGVINATDDAKLSQHLATCATCVSDLREQLAIRTLLRAEPLVAAPRSFALPYAPRTALASEPGAITKLLRSIQVATAAAAMVLVALVGLNVMDTSPSTIARQESTIAAMESPEPSTGTDALASREPSTAESLDIGDGSTTNMLAAPPTSASVGITDPEPSLDPNDTGLTGDSTVESLESIAKARPPISVPDASGAPESAFAIPAPTDDRSALEWALLTASFITAVLALAVVAITWRSRRAT